MRLRISITAITFLITIALFAQDISRENLLWKVDSLIDLRTMERFAYSCTFETKGSDQITWNQKDGFASSIEVKTSTGNWSNIQANGSISYQAKYEEESGAITFERTKLGYRIKLFLGPDAKPSLRHEYRVSSVTKLP